MIRIIKVLLGMAFFTTVAYLAWQNETGKTISEADQLLSGDTTVSTGAKTAQTPPLDKAQVDFLIQQQYQKTLSQAPKEDELSDSEKLQMLQDALHEINSAEDEYDRELAVMTLGELSSIESKQGIITALRDESNLVVFQAIRQINKWQNPAERTDMLLTALQSHNDDIIEQTLLSISVVEDKRLIARLKQLSKHTNPDIREAARLALNLAP